MKKSSLLITFSVVALVGISGQAFAQTAAAPIAPPTFGAPTAGQCVFDTNAAINNSKMGKAALDRINQLAGVVQSELTTQGTQIDADRKALEAAQPPKTATAAVTQAFQVKAQAWEQRAQALQALVDQRQQEMQATKQVAFSNIFNRMVPQINAVVTAKGCSTVVSADSLVRYMPPGANDASQAVVYVNPAMDITSAVVQKLDATGELLPTFQRYDLSQQQGAAPAQ